MEDVSNINISPQNANVNNVRTNIPSKVRNIDDFQIDTQGQKEIFNKNFSASGTAQGKAQRIQGYYENDFINTAGEALNVPNGAQREFLRPIAQKMSSEIKATRKVSEETAQKLFDTACK